MRSTASSSSGSPRRPGGNLDATVLSPITGGASQINIYGAVEGASVYRPNALTGDPNHLAIELLVPLLVLLPIYLRLERGNRFRVPLMVTLMILLAIELATFSRSGLLGLFFGLLVLAVPYRHLFLRPRFLAPLGAVFLILLVLVAQRASFFETVIKSRVDTSGKGTSTHFSVYEFIPQVLSQHPLFGLGLNNFSVYYEFVTGRNNFGPHSFYVALFVESGVVGALLFARVPRLPLLPALGGPVDRPGAAGRRGRARGTRAPDGVGADRGARRDDGLELLLPDDELLLLLRPRDARDRGARGVRAPASPVVKVCVLTTSYPRHPGDVAGGFVRDAVVHLERAGVEVTVVSPDSFRHFGIAYGDGIANNLALEPLAGAAAAAVPGLVRAGGATGRPGRRRRACALAAVGASPGSRRASRSCSRPGARTSSSRSACRGSSGRCSAGRASSSVPRPRSPPTAGRSARATCA